MKKKYQGIDRRKFVRLDYVSPLVYKICKKENIDKLLKGNTSNISESGMCIYSDSAHDEGEIIEIRSALPVAPSRAAVKWARKDAAGLYKMGLMFIE